MYIFIKTIFWFVVFKFQELGEWISNNYKDWFDSLFRLIALIVMVLLMFIPGILVVLLIGLIIIYFISIIFWSFPDVSNIIHIKELIAIALVVGLLASVIMMLIYENLSKETILKITKFFKDNWQKAKERANS
jgi:hypothetical protein